MAITYPQRQFIKLDDVDYPVVVQPFVGGIPLIWDPVTGFPKTSSGAKPIPISPSAVAHIKIKYNKPIAGDLFFNSHSTYTPAYLAQCVSGEVKAIEPVTFLCYEVSEPGLSTSSDRIEVLNKVPRDIWGYVMKAKGDMDTIKAMTAKDELRLHDLMNATLWLRGVTGVRLRGANDRWESTEYIIAKPAGWKPKKRAGDAK